MLIGFVILMNFIRVTGSELKGFAGISVGHPILIDLLAYHRC